MNDLHALYDPLTAGPPNEAELDALLDRMGEEGGPWPAYIEQLLRDPEMSGLGMAEQRDRLFRQIMQRRDNQRRLRRLVQLPLFRRAAAAILILLAGAGAWLFHNHPAHPSNPLQYIAPGHNGAILHLSNGNSIILDSAQDGTIARQNGVEAIKTNGSLRYTGSATAVVYNTISTDRGRQWQLTLPDGTKVWLNAASSITYPTAFKGQDRQVTVTGEAYLEVVHNAKQPFKVIASGQTIQDIGTSFNINAYTDEPAVKITLVEGAAKVTHGPTSVLLKPGQQARITSDIQIEKGVDLEAVLAWKNGRFQFQGAGIEEVMRQIARWYDVDIQYQGHPIEQHFRGGIPRQADVSKVLTLLETTGAVHFKTDHKKIIVMP